jgi:uncharacterized protein
MSILGRHQERKIFDKMLQSNTSEFMAIIGRRRVGKTFLIEQHFANHIVLQMSGQKDFTNQQHMQLFAQKLKTTFPKTKLPNQNNNWLNIFLNLIACLEQDKKKNKQKIVLFFDELPWLCKQKSGFLAALAFFWNDWARKHNIKLIVCGSAASWMLSNIVNEKGSLYNRITKVVRLQPFTLAETKEYLQHKQIHFNTEQLIQIYMVMGGIPFYLNEIEAGLSAVQNIQKICFAPNGLLYQEYGHLYDALFNNSHDYKKIIEVLFAKKRGMTKMEIASATKLTPNGKFYNKLDELVACGFLIEMQDFSKKSKVNLFRLIDEYSLFYHQFIKKQKVITDDYWFSVFNTAAYNAWSGYAFENFCLRHTDKIIDALRIGGMQFQIGSFYAKKNDDADGAQIDIIIDRADQCVNLIECKFFKEEFYLSAQEATKIKKRKAAFTHYSKTKKQIFITLISIGTLIASKESIGLIDQDISGRAFE